ncbi:hypothetical protein NA57DRAFT_73723 [Rhizodiscina lignyota]|uniref:Zn(2)-C6 fungal-type domain-containing protein n=1 Tax=Rhizodiscina lignyota TaxID=1504668 RepID=A0A9P4ME61_9PEZI|nr:hypothetical protein NA57DRAFT_73723 [Rhizodiscina lignyota]
MSSASPTWTPGSNIVPLKRPRPVKSCLSCRSKKLKCDREQPCAQCIRMNRAEQCDYDEHAGSLSVHARDVPRSQTASRPEASAINHRQPLSRTPDLNRNRLEASGVPSPGDDVRELKARVERLENLISRINGINDQSMLPPHNDTKFPSNERFTDDETAHGKMRYQGLSNTRSLVALFPDVESYSQALLSDPNLKPEFENLRRMFPKEKTSRERSPPVSIESILSIIPAQDVGEHLVTSYATNFPKIYQVLHLATFRRQCSRFWDLDAASNEKFRTEFGPLLALVTSLGSNFWQQQTSGPCLNLHKTCALVDDWLSGLDCKKQLQPMALQTSCILVLSMGMLSMPSVRIWQYSGDLVRSALAIGLHKDPDELDPQMSPLQANLRRRLWYIIANLDAEVSILSCLPSLVQVTPYSCRVPTAVPTEDVSMDATEEIQNYGPDDTDDITYQSELVNSLPLRLRALQVLTQSPANPTEIRMVLEDLEARRISLPSPLRFSDSMSASDSMHTYNNMMLDMCFRRPMISLNTLGLQCPGYLETKDDVAHCIGLCMAVMSLSEVLDADLSDEQFTVDDHIWRLFQVFNLDDIIRAAYSACFCLRLIDEAARTPEEQRTIPQFDLNIPKSAVRRSVEDLVKTYLNKKSDLRPVLKQVMALAMASESTKQARTEAAKQDLMRASLLRVLQQCRERHAADERRGSHGSQSVHSDSASLTSTLDYDQFLWPDFDLDYTSFSWDMGLLPEVQMP